MSLRLRIPVEPQYEPPIWNTPVPHDMAAILEARENAAREAWDLHQRQERDRELMEYEKAVAERGVGPFYGWSQPSTAGTPPRK